MDTSSFYYFKRRIIKSNWTHVDGKITLKVRSRGIGDDSPIYRIIADAPKITGSEEDCIFSRCLRNE